MCLAVEIGFASYPDRSAWGFHEQDGVVWQEAPGRTRAGGRSIISMDVLDDIFLFLFHRWAT